jgi:hypothetical protein
MYYRELPEELRQDTILLHVIPDCYGEIMEESSANDRIIVRREVVVTTERFDDYLFASDAVVLHKFQSREHAVVSTTALQAVGTGCPVCVPKQSDFFHCFDKEIIHYESAADLDEQLVDVLNNESSRHELLRHAETFVEAHSPMKIAQQFIEVFEQLLKD